MRFVEVYKHKYEFCFLTLIQKLQFNNKRKKLIKRRNQKLMHVTCTTRLMHNRILKNQRIYKNEDYLHRQQKSYIKKTNQFLKKSVLIFRNKNKGNYLVICC